MVSQSAEKIKQKLSWIKSINEYIDELASIKDADYSTLNHVYQAVSGQKQDKYIKEASKKFTLYEVYNELYSRRNSVDNICEHALGFKTVVDPDLVKYNKEKSWSSTTCDMNFIDFKSTKFGDLEINTQWNRFWGTIIRLDTINGKNILPKFPEITIETEIGFKQKEHTMSEFVRFVY